MFIIYNLESNLLGKCKNEQNEIRISPMSIERQTPNCPMSFKETNPLKEHHNSKIARSRTMTSYLKRIPNLSANHLIFNP